MCKFNNYFNHCYHIISKGHQLEHQVKLVSMVIPLGIIVNDESNSLSQIWFACIIKVSTCNINTQNQCVISVILLSNNSNMKSCQIFILLMHSPIVTHLGSHAIVPLGKWICSRKIGYKIIYAGQKNVIPQKIMTPLHR